MKQQRQNGDSLPHLRSCQYLLCHIREDEAGPPLYWLLSMRMVTGRAPKSSRDVACTHLRCSISAQEELRALIAVLSDALGAQQALGTRHCALCAEVKYGDAQGRQRSARAVSMYASAGMGMLQVTVHVR